MCNNREVHRLTASWAEGETIPFPTLREQFPTLDLNTGIMPLWTTLRDAGYRQFSRALPLTYIDERLQRLIQDCVPDYNPVAVKRIAINLQARGLADSCLYSGLMSLQPVRVPEPAI